MAARFFLGDENGQVKSITCTKNGSEEEFSAEVITVEDGPGEGKTRNVQKLAVGRRGSDSRLLAVARSDRTTSVYTFDASNSQIQPVHSWKETRVKTPASFVGLSISERGVFTCTNTGHFRRTTLPSDSEPSTSQTACLPMRLCDLRISADSSTFAYGGDEVDLSIWDVERALSSPPPVEGSLAAGQKRKKGKGVELFPGEVWRAKNLPNDSLSLRQPVHITSLTYLPQTSNPGSSQPSHSILTGTKLGAVRRYDTRAARRPVADWQGIGKVGGVKKIEKSMSEYEAFVSDNGSNLFSIDTRCGRVLYGYQGISGAISGMAPTPNYLASISLDRFFRLHTMHEPPASPGPAAQKKGQTVSKTYVKSIPTVVVWDEEVVPVTEDENAQDKDGGDRDEDEDGEDVWGGMEMIKEDEESDEDEAPKRKVQRGKDA